MSLLCKINLRISTAGKRMGINRTINTFNLKNIFHIIDQIKDLKVPLWIWHCHLCMKIFGYNTVKATKISSATSEIRNIWTIPCWVKSRKIFETETSWGNYGFYSTVDKLSNILQHFFIFPRFFFKLWNCNNKLFLDLLVAERIGVIAANSNLSLHILILLWKNLCLKY